MVVKALSRIPEKNLSDHHYKTSRAGFPVGPRVGAHGRDKDPSELALAVPLSVTNTVTIPVTIPVTNTVTKPLRSPMKTATLGLATSPDSLGPTRKCSTNTSGRFWANPQNFGKYWW